MNIPQRSQRVRHWLHDLQTHTPDLCILKQKRNQAFDLQPIRDTFISTPISIISVRNNLFAIALHNNSICDLN